MSEEREFSNSFRNRRMTITLNKDDVSELKREVETEDHEIPLDVLCDKYDTDVTQGLDSNFAAELFLMLGPNALTAPKPPSKWAILAGYLFGGFAPLLWVGAILSFSSLVINYIRTGEKNFDDLTLGGVMVAVVLITAFFGYYQEQQNMLVMEGFSKLIPKTAVVIRNGVTTRLPNEELVVGDLVKIESGGCVPADVRIIASNALKVDNSSITGESEPQPRSSTCTNKNPLETANVAFYGSNVVEGSGLGIVIGTGKNTVMGHIAGLTTRLDERETRIKQELSAFMRMLTILSVAVAGTCWAFAISEGYNFFVAFSIFISILIGNIPEALLVTLTACLTLTAKIMAEKNCLVKNLHAIETLGSTSVICSDKTGTLTQNRMTVSHLYYDGKVVDILDDDFMPYPTSSLKYFCRAAILCSRADYDLQDVDLAPEQRRIIGDASESAVLKCMETLVGDPIERRKINPKVCEIPFNSRNKFQVSVHRRRNGNFLAVMKGAPEVIIDRCATIYTGNTTKPIDSYKTEIESAIFDMGSMGERVLAYADLNLPEDKYPREYEFDSNRPNFPLTDLRFVGLSSLIDPPKTSVYDAVIKCQTAGIRVIMLTGDHPVTALAIARKVGIVSPNKVTVYDIAREKHVSPENVSQVDRDGCDAAVVAGWELREMSDEQLHHIIGQYKEIVFARTSPQQKLMIVEAFQNQGHVVAVTGDGVNDSPALKQADIGISMGISGSDVSKEAADMILLDDNFATIVTGVEEGRLIFDNLKKSIAYLLTSNLPEIVPFLVLLFFHTPPVLSVIAVIIIDVGTDMWPAICYAYEHAEADIMLRKPRNPETEKLVNYKLMLFTYILVGLTQTVAGMTAYFFTMAYHGFFYDRVIGLRDAWANQYVNDLQDSYGQEWSFMERTILEKKCYSAYFMAIVIVQVADTYICKTRRLSVFRQHNNFCLNCGVIFEIVLAFFFVYCPGVNRIAQFEPVAVYCFLPAIPYGILLIVCDELRRYCIRRYPGGWFERNTYY